MMPSTVAELLFGCRNWFGKHSSDVWNLVPACLVWLVWKERNGHIFEDAKKTLEQLHSLLIYT